MKKKHTRTKKPDEKTVEQIVKLWPNQLEEVNKCVILWGIPIETIMQMTCTEFNQKRAKNG